MVKVYPSVCVRAWRGVAGWCGDASAEMVPRSAALGRAVPGNGVTRPPGPWAHWPLVTTGPGQSTPARRPAPTYTSATPPLSNTLAG